MYGVTDEGVGVVVAQPGNTVRYIFPNIRARSSAVSGRGHNTPRTRPEPHHILVDRREDVGLSLGRAHHRIKHGLHIYGCPVRGRKIEWRTLPHIGRGIPGAYMDECGNRVNIRSHEWRMIRVAHNQYRVERNFATGSRNKAMSRVFCANVQEDNLGARRVGLDQVSYR